MDHLFSSCLHQQSDDSAVTPLTKFHLSFPKPELPSIFPTVASAQFDEYGDTRSVQVNQHLCWASHHPNLTWEDNLAPFEPEQSL